MKIQTFKKNVFSAASVCCHIFILIESHHKMRKLVLGNVLKYNLTHLIVLYCTVLCCAVLYCTVLQCIVLYCTVLCCIVLYCIVLYCIVLYCAVLYCTVLYCTVFYCIVLYCTVLHCPISYCTVLYCIVLYYIALYCTVLYCIALYCIVLYYTILYCGAFYCTHLTVDFMHLSNNEYQQIEFENGRYLRNTDSYSFFTQYMHLITGVKEIKKQTNKLIDISYLILMLLMKGMDQDT